MIAHAAKSNRKSMQRLLRSILAPGTIRKSAEQVQSPAIRKVDPSGVSVMAVQCFESSALALGTSAKSSPRISCKRFWTNSSISWSRASSNLQTYVEPFARLHLIDALWQSFILPNRCAAASASASHWPMRTKKKPPRLRSRSRFRGRGHKNFSHRKPRNPPAWE